MATASVTEKATTPRPPTARPNLVSVGTIVWLSSELMFFAALFAIYFTIRSVDKGNGIPWPGAHLDLTLGSINTTVLLLSSVTCQLGVFAVERGQIRPGRPDLAGVALGTAGVVRPVVPDGPVLRLRPGLRVPGPDPRRADPPSSGYGSVFFIPTGFHGLHVTGGLIAFLFVLGRTYVAKTFTHEQQVSAIVVSYYWHFVDVVWIGLFTTIYLIH